MAIEGVANRNRFLAMVFAAGVATAALILVAPPLVNTQSLPGSAILLGLGLICPALVVTYFHRQRIHTLKKDLRHLREEHRNACQKAERAENRFQHLLDNAGDAIILLDPHTGNLRTANRRAEALLGYSVDEIRRLSPEVLFPGREKRRYLQLVKRVLRDGYGEHNRLVFQPQNGKPFTGAVHARLGDLGAEQMVHVVVRDISHTVRIEEELRRKNRKLLLSNEIAHCAARSRDLPKMLNAVLEKLIADFSAAGGGVYLIRGPRRPMYLTAHRGISVPPLKELERLAPGQGLAGQVASSGRIRTSTDLQRDRRLHARAVRAAGWRGFCAVPIAAGDETVGVFFLFSWEKRVPTTEDLGLLEAVGKQIGTAVYGAENFDALQWQYRLTQASNRELKRSRRQLQENLTRMEEANRKLERLERVKSNFLALASHELRTPLTCVLAGAELLETTLDEKLSEEERRTVEAIRHGGERLQKIVQDLLEIARIESQRLYVAREPIDLPALLQTLRQQFHPLLCERRLQFRIGEFPAPLPLQGDPHHLQEAFRRLVENAIKFTPEGGSIDVEASVQNPDTLREREAVLGPFSPDFFRNGPDRPHLQVTVRDNGVGVAPDERLRIFDKFYEIGDIAAHSSSQTRFGGKGTGLGLTLVKGLIEAHRGMVWVESSAPDREPEGSAFHVLLPLAASNDSEQLHGA